MDVCEGVPVTVGLPIWVACPKCSAKLKIGPGPPSGCFGPVVRVMGDNRRCLDCGRLLGPNETWMSSEEEPEKVYCVKCGRSSMHW